MQQQSKGYGFLLIVLGLALLSGYLFYARPFQLGLDVRGGVRLTYEMDLSKLTPEQRQNISEVRSNLKNILENRAGGALGVAEPQIQVKGENEFIVELPGFTNATQARQILSSTAKLIAYHARNVATDKAAFRTYLRGEEELIEGNPVVTFTRRNDPSRVLKPGDPEYARMIEGWTKILEGDELARAEARVEGTLTQPHFLFSSSGGRKMESWSRRVLNQGEMLAFVLDGRVLSIAPLKDGAILRDNAFIDGQFDPAYVNGLVRLLNAGALPVELKETSSQKVDPTIGRFALDQMLLAGYISFGVVALFLLAYYSFPGVVALLALLLYMLFTLTVLKWTGATFSLAAIAGFILSIGIAVDANILVFERLKEELRNGKPLNSAINLGFKRAFPAILDSNVCTILTSAVLWFLGTGPVKGFASTLVIGVAISLFTAVAVTRSLLVFLVGSGLGSRPELYGLNRQWFGEKYEQDAGNKQLRIVETSRKWFAISLLTILPGIVFISLGGLKPNVEFTGGFEAGFTMPATGGLTPAQVRANLEKGGLSGSNVKFAESGGQRIMYITVPSTASLRPEDPQAGQKLAQIAGKNPNDLRELSTVGPTVSAETYRNAILGVIISSLLIISYLTMRFGLAIGSLGSGLKFALSAIGALVHDILVVVGVAAMMGYFFGWEISALFITAMLTVIGFSVHDTIVVFDRIRENLRTGNPGESFDHLCNKSITQSLARSINTSLTVIVTLIILIVWGTPTVDLKFFSLTMLIGIVSGTYSSIYNATPILYLWNQAIVRRRGPEASLVAEAERERQRLRAAALAMSAAAPGYAGAETSYGQVRRRQSAVDQAKRPLDEE